jgi:hypothetical protein
MNSLGLDKVQEYVDESTTALHQQETKLLQELCLSRLLERLCLFGPACTMSVANDVVEDLLDAFLCSSGEVLFEAFLKCLAIFIASHTCSGHKSTAPGVDLEFENKGIYYIVSVKSGPSWGNSSQQSKLAEDLQKAVMRVKQSQHGANVQPVLGICYGKTRTNYLRGYLKVVGQNFWYLISENEDLYTDIIEPIGYRAKEHNDAFHKEKARVINRFTKEFIDRFCDATGAIDWVKLVEFNSGNYDLDKFLS